MTPLLEASGVSRRFVGGDGLPFVVLEHLDLAVSPGEFVAIVGASGSGKSTLLHLLGGLDQADEGEVRLEGLAYAGLDGRELSRVRNTRIGFVFQFHHLLRDFTAIENVMMPLLIGGTPLREARSAAAAILDTVGLTHRHLSRVTVLSGGEQQRVALARALVHRPAVVLADEPTGNLDPPNAHALHELLATVARVGGTGLVAVTHNRDLAHRADRVLAMEDGRLRTVAPGEFLP